MEIKQAAPSDALGDTPTAYTLVKQRFREAADPERAKQMAAYMRNQFEFYGISSSDRTACYRDVLKDEKKTGAVDWWLVQMSQDDPHREFQYFAMDYLTRMVKFLELEDLSKLKVFIETKSWWDTIDALAKNVVGVVCASDERGDDLMRIWAEDDSFWVRRTAILHQLRRKKQTNKDLLSDTIISNFGSDEFFINKAIGWALREYSKVNPDWVRSFIDEHLESMNSLSVREASKYI